MDIIATPPLPPEEAKVTGQKLILKKYLAVLLLSALLDVNYLEIKTWQVFGQNLTHLNSLSLLSQF